MLGRLKFELDGLVDEMLDQLPKTVWTSSTTTFFDPAIGGGQFVKVVERRLRKYGHSDKNIAGRVSGCESNAMRVQYAKRRHKLVGRYVAGNFLSEEFGMGKKFDVIVGNPPYQEHREHGKKITGNGALWVRFIVKSIELTHDAGTIAMLTPDSWTSPTKDLMGQRKSIFQDYFQQYNLKYINFDCSKYFSVGVSIAAFVLKKSAYQGKTVIIKDATINDYDISKFTFIPRDMSPTSMSIHKKVLAPIENERKFKLRWVKEVAKNERQDKKDKAHRYPCIDNHSHKPIRWSVNVDPDQKKRKVLMTYVGRYQIIVDDKGEYGADPQVGVFFLNNNETGPAAESIFNSRLYRFLVEGNKWMQFNLVQIINMIPLVDLTRIWTDTELYKHFDLTQEEIDYIEATVK